MRPENAGALSTIEKIDELMAMQGRRPVVEFNRADINHSGGVSGKLQGKSKAVLREGTTFVSWTGAGSIRVHWFLQFCCALQHFAVLSPVVCRNMQKQGAFSRSASLSARKGGRVRTRSNRVV